MADKPWKACERAVAKRLGGQRVPITGRGRGDAPDVAAEGLAVEVKERRQLPQWIREAGEQAKAAAKVGELPVVILHELGRRHDGDLVLMVLSDFEAWLLGRQPAETEEE
jgi:molybdopterin synthase catalytic subunit